MSVAPTPAPLQVDASNDLMRWLPHDFDKNPSPQLALRLDYDGAMVWTIDKSGRLTTQVSGGSGASISVPLAPYTLANLVTVLNGYAGYTAVLVADSLTAQCNARAGTCQRQ